MSQKPMPQNTGISPNELMQLLLRPQRPPQAMYPDAQLASAPALPTQQEIFGRPEPMAANDPFFANAASSDQIDDMEVNKYRQLIYELRKNGYFPGAEGMQLLEDRNALLNPVMQATVNLAAEVDPFVSTIKEGTRMAEQKFPQEMEAFRQKQALEKWKLQKYHEAKIREMMSNKLMVGH